MSVFDNIADKVCRHLEGSQAHSGEEQAEARPRGNRNGESQNMPINKIRSRSWFCKRKSKIKVRPPKKIPQVVLERKWI